MIKIRNKKRYSRKGMAMLMVLFIVMAIAIITTGFIARSDAALQCGSNYTHRREADYLAWGGLEHARALVSSPDNFVPLPCWSGTALQLEAASEGYYDLTIEAPVTVVTGDPSEPVTYRYTVNCSAYYIDSGSIQSRCTMTGILYYAPISTDCYYISVTHP